MKIAMTRLEIESQVLDLNHDSFNYHAPRAGVFPVSAEVRGGRNRKLYNLNAVECFEKYFAARKSLLKGGGKNVRGKSKTNKT